MMTYRCAERGCALTKEDLEKKKCPTCRHPMNAISEEVADAPAEPAPAPAPSPTPPQE